MTVNKRELHYAPEAILSAVEQYQLVRVHFKARL